MTDTLKAGDTVWTVEGECIRNFDDDYYDIQIPTYVCHNTVKEYIEHNTRYVVITTDGGYYSNSEYRTEYYLTEDEALKALQEKRKQFLKYYPNNWKKIVEELKQLIEEQSNG